MIPQIQGLKPYTFTREHVIECLTVQDLRPKYQQLHVRFTRNFDQMALDCGLALAVFMEEHAYPAAVFYAAQFLGGVLEPELEVVPVVMNLRNSCYVGAAKGGDLPPPIQPALLSVPVQSGQTRQP